MERVLKTTEDGSHTLYIPELEEHYHSIHGAIQEAVHVYINAGLNYYSKEEVNILEIGFGTGLNALLTYSTAEKTNRKINYTSVELYPLDKQITDNLNYGKAVEGDYNSIFHALHSAKWNTESKISDFFNLYKMQADIKETIWKDKYDVVYFDAFAPEVQPDLWTEDIFSRIYNAMNQEGVLTTYCVKGIVKRAVKSAGFQIKRLPGAKGKREMLRATKSK